MALKQKNVEFKKMAEGATVKGYLISTAMPEISYKGGKPGPVPKLTLQDENGETFSVLLGKAALSDLDMLTPRAWTEVTKGKKVVVEGGNSYNPYTIAQDDEKLLK